MPIKDTQDWVARARALAPMIEAAAGRVGHDDPYQPRGISLLRAACFAWQEEGERGQLHKTDLDPSHRRLSRAPWRLKGAAQC